MILARSHTDQGGVIQLLPVVDEVKDIAVLERLVDNAERLHGRVARTGEKDLFIGVKPDYGVTVVVDECCSDLEIGAGLKLNAAESGPSHLRTGRRYFLRSCSDLLYLQEQGLSR